MPAGNEPGGKVTVFTTLFDLEATRWTVPPFRFVTQIEPSAYVRSYVVADRNRRQPLPARRVEAVEPARLRHHPPSGRASRPHGFEDRATRVSTTAASGSPPPGRSTAIRACPLRCVSRRQEALSRVSPGTPAGNLAP
jgi:hypothetical protein